MKYTDEERKQKICPMMKAPCMGAECMKWEWEDVVEELAITRNLTTDQETMTARIKSHPHEMSVWKKPIGEPPTPPGNDWERDGPMQSAPNYLDGTMEQRWARRRRKYGRCGL
jgi:hypothetical protein